MNLLEHRGKALLKKCGIKIPPHIVTNNKSYINLSYHKEKYKEFFFDHKKVIIKAQIIGGSRKKQGFIFESQNFEESLKLIDNLYKKKYRHQKINTLLIEKKLNVAEEFFLAIIYDSISRKPKIILSKQGGINVESFSNSISELIVSPLEGLHNFQLRSLAKKSGFKGKLILKISKLIKNAYKCFEKYDCQSLEINPIILTEDGMLYAADAKIKIDGNAITRQKDFVDVTETEDQSLLNPRELAARKIDLHDYRGVAGKTFIDLDGDIAILASGGGASLTAMDALIESGGSPSNYTEYSGNPSREKVKQLTALTLSKPGIKGCLVIGGRANFTDIKETLSGFMDGVLSLESIPKYPIIIRRWGPNAAEAFDMIRNLSAQHNLNIELHGEDTPISQAAKIMVEKVNGNTN